MAAGDDAAAAVDGQHVGPHDPACWCGMDASGLRTDVVCPKHDCVFTVHHTPPEHVESVCDG